jgi:hypothetical protein
LTFHPDPLQHQALQLSATELKRGAASR